jgi:outer membrane protein TolC
MPFKRRCLAVAMAFVGHAAGQQNQFLGSVPSGDRPQAPIALSLRETIDRGLRTNLGLLISDSASESARGKRMQALSALLPRVDAHATQVEEQLNLATIGFSLKIPGVSINNISGPFHYTDVRGSAAWNVYDGPSRQRLRAAEQARRAAQLSNADARDLVVQAAASGYLTIIADTSSVEATRSQVETAQALFDRATDQQKAGTAAAIDVLRAQVELKQQQQRLLSRQDQLEKDKLALGRVIGLPDGQEFQQSETVPFAPLNAITLDEAIRKALEQRSDYKSAQALVQAAEAQVKAARAERWPTASVSADYGDVGSTLTNSHGTFTVTGTASINLFNGGRIAGEVVDASAALKQRRDELADLRAEIGYQVRATFLDVRTAADQVKVARDNVDLAGQTLDQARDRFNAGVTDNIEVIQAQESVANANDAAILALYAHNAAKVALARNLGGAEQSIRELLELK